MLVVVYFLPEKFPNNIIPLAYTLGFFQFAKQLDIRVGEHRKLHPDSQKGSTWKVVWVSLLFLMTEETPSLSTFTGALIMSALRSMETKTNTPEANKKRGRLISTSAKRPTRIKIES
jgi:hypothetical protein